MTTQSDTGNGNETITVRTTDSTGRWIDTGQYTGVSTFNTQGFSSIYFMDSLSDKVRNLLSMCVRQFAGKFTGKEINVENMTKKQEDDILLYSLKAMTYVHQTWREYEKRG